MFENFGAVGVIHRNWSLNSIGADLQFL